MKYASLSEDEAERAVAAYRERYSGIGIYENRIYDGIKEMLNRLLAEQITLAVASSKPEAFVRQVLRYFGIEQYFRVIVGSGMDGTMSRKSEVINECLRRLGIEGRRDLAVLVGDRRYDMEGAREAGISAIGVTYGYGSREELEACRPDCIVDSPEELKNVLYWQFVEGRPFPGPARMPAGQVKLQSAEDYRALNWSSERKDPRKSGAVVPGDGSVLFRIWRILYPVLIQYGVTFLVVGIVQVLVYAVTGGGDLPGYAVILTGAADAALVPVFMVLMRRDEEVRRIRKASFRLLTPIRMNIWNIGAVILFTSGTTGVLNFIVGMLNIQDSAYDSLAESMVESTPLVLILVVVLIGPVMEELLFRGILYRRLRDYLGVGWAAALSGVFFGVIHGNLVQGVYAGLFGVVLALLYEHFGTLAAPLTAHFTNNLTASFAILPDGIPPLMALAVCVLLTVAFSMIIFRKSSRVNVV